MPKRFRVNNLTLHLDEDESVLRQRAADKMGVPPEDFEDFAIVKRSLDARHKPRYQYNVEVAIEAADVLDRLAENHSINEAPDPEADRPRKFDVRKKERVAIVGAGPSGLFCAHRLAECGLEPILIDRGQPVEVRGRQVSRLMHKGELDPDSNICFGEGGAGTWSDGKLYTRVSDIRVKHILETIVELGGPEDILVSNKPHLGTDRLVALCKAFRERLTDMGASVRFGSFVEDFTIDRSTAGDKVTQVVLRDGERIDVDRVVCAVGHSAREMYRWYAENGVALEQKPFAVGFRVEHRQKLINEIQYGRWADEESLPTADYRLTANLGDGPDRRGVYSFCMCPGGQVVPSPTQEGGVCVNGMSHASRRGHFANSALVVTIEPEDFGAFGDIAGIEDYDGLLAGMAFQREAERRAYQQGGGDFVAPAQRLTDFHDGQATAELRKTSYKPGIAPGDLAACYPEFVIDALREALDSFEESMHGFLTDDAILIGVETRTSAPVQVLRDEETLQSVSLQGFYPAGEGAGYGGGIVSAALDGIRVAERILEELSA